MSATDRLRLILHGAIVLLAGLLSGFPTVVEAMQGEAPRYWHTAHEALIMMGIWMLAASSLLPVLVLAKREARVLLWSLYAMGYGFVVALVLGGAIGVSPFSPGDTPASVVAFAAATLGIGGAVIAAALTLMGAAAALKASRGP
ncbi:MAG TPA: hypothetical protein VFK78_00935 [Gemmatimonadales bacterium]|nr:hypothetical protein [Gemmatimonadales bacterium]